MEDLKNKYIKEILEWSFNHGYNHGLVSQKLNEMKRHILNFQSADDRAETFKENLLDDINYLFEILD